MNIESESRAEAAVLNRVEEENPDFVISDVAYEMLEKACDGNTSKSYTICFVCTGNTCRSPMAAAVFNDMVKNGFLKNLVGISDSDNKESTDDAVNEECTSGIMTVKERLKSVLSKNSGCKIRAVSAGIVPNVGEEISRGASSALLRAGIESDPDNPWAMHKATALDRNIVEECDIIVGISGYHAMAIMSMYPEYASKVTSMPHDISDPYGGNDDVYVKCLNEIKEGLKDLFS